MSAGWPLPVHPFFNLNLMLSLSGFYYAWLLKAIRLLFVLPTSRNRIEEEDTSSGKDKEKLLNKFLKLLPKITAAGGKVINLKGEILFIYRNNKWDLPKGKAEDNETIADTAIREVKEETGIAKLVITKPLEITYHIFKKNNTYRIKVTYWFEMKSIGDNQLTPQIEEGITRAEWINSLEIDKIKKKCYANIRLLI